jgi:hypothetical protein
VTAIAYTWTEIVAATVVDAATSPHATVGERKQFADLVEQWRKETGHLSSLTQRAAHPAYQRIIQMGPPAVELLLEELQRRPDNWFDALYAITGHDPVAPAERGRMSEMVAAWVHWGKANGYLQ